MKWTDCTLCDADKFQICKFVIVLPPYVDKNKKINSPPNAFFTNFTAIFLNV